MSYFAHEKKLRVVAQDPPAGQALWLAFLALVTAILLGYAIHEHMRVTLTDQFIAGGDEVIIADSNSNNATSAGTGNGGDNQGAGASSASSNAR